MDNNNRGHGPVRHAPSECPVCRWHDRIERYVRLARDSGGLALFAVRLYWRRLIGNKDRGGDADSSEGGSDA